MKSKIKFKHKVWMVTRIDQCVLLAKYLNDIGLLIRWDSFIRLSKSGLLKYFFKFSKRIMTDKLSNIKGNHFLPEIISRFLKFVGYKKHILFQDLILAKLAAAGYSNSFDILHGQGPYCLEAAKLAKKNGKIFVYEISGQMQKTRIKQLKKIHNKYNIPLDTGISFLQNRRIEEAKIADAIVCPSNIVKKELSKLGYDKKKIFTYNHDSSLSKELISLKKKQTKKIQLLFVGEMSISKGVQHVINIQKKLKLSGIKSELNLFGNKKHNFLLHELDKFNINYHGLVRKNILKKYYLKSDIFIFPSYTEGSALVIYEAMASGLPIITSKESGSITKHNINGYICNPQDEEKMFNYTKKLINQKKLRIQMGKNSRRIYSKEMKYSYPEQLIKIYSKIININAS